MIILEFSQAPDYVYADNIGTYCMEQSRILWKCKQLHAFVGNRYLTSRQQSRGSIMRYISYPLWKGWYSQGLTFLDLAISLLVDQSSLFGPFIFHVCYKDLVSCIRIKFWRTEEKFPIVAMLAAAFNSVFHTVPVDSEDD